MNTYLKFMISMLFRMGNVSEKFVVIINPHILCSVFFFPLKIVPIVR